MKNLTLIRHAKSSWKDSGMEDIKRPLNKRGKRNAPEMGQRLRIMEFRPDLIVSSPAKRAMVTAKIIAEEIGYKVSRIEIDDHIYAGEINDLLAVIWNLDDELEHVAICGHNPALTELVNYLSAAGIDNVPTCGVVDLFFETESWSEIGAVQAKAMHIEAPEKGE